MAQVTCDVDINDYVDEIDTSILLDELFRRAEHFSSRKIRDIIIDLDDMLEDVEMPYQTKCDLTYAQNLFDRRKYNEMLIYLERSLGMKGLSNIKVLDG